uniref:Reverse transcriptase n=1 Tax=Timema poppense TaxID=170557 RepID=A0A7R9DMM5_TIMPO|nr:unnamed protein product [Timema poppensis]
MYPRIGMWPDILACQPGTSVVLVGGDTGDAGCGHDLLIVIKGYSRRNLEGKSNQVLEELDTLCKSVKLKMAPAKTTYMLFKGRLARDPTIKVGRKSIRRSLTVRYLGVTPDENRNFTAHMEQVTGKTLSVINKTISMRQRRFYLPMRIIKTYHQNILLSIVSYEACIWAHRLTNVVPAKVIQGLQRNILPRLAGAYWTVATDSPSVALENKHLQPSQGLVHFITASLRKLGLTESGTCDCGEEGTPEHVVLEFILTLEARRNYQREIQGRSVGEVLRDPIYWKGLNQIALEASDRVNTDLKRKSKRRIARHFRASGSNLTREGSGVSPPAVEIVTSRFQSLKGNFRRSQERGRPLKSLLSGSIRRARVDCVLPLCDITCRCAPLARDACGVILIYSNILAPRLTTRSGYTL